MNRRSFLKVIAASSIAAAAPSVAFIAKDAPHAGVVIGHLEESVFYQLDIDAYVYMVSGKIRGVMYEWATILQGSKDEAEERMPMMRNVAQAAFEMAARKLNG